MYLSRLKIRNFRKIRNLDIELTPGINLFVGENDSGKSALIDAIRLTLGTRDFEWLNVSTEDFHVDKSGRARELSIECVFRGFNEDEASVFNEWLGSVPSDHKTDDDNRYLKIRLSAIRKDETELQNRFDRLTKATWVAGPDADGTQMEREARESLRVTYLKPLRDAEHELAARRGSRFSQILHANDALHVDTEDNPGLVQIVTAANNDIKTHPAIKQQIDSLNTNYLQNFTLGEDPIHAKVDIAHPKLRHILESLKLALADDNEIEDDTDHGLGVKNLLFMATELLLLQNAVLPLILIEEPEAHLHPQLQFRLIAFLERKLPTINDQSVQVLMTSHSPNLSSNIDLQRVILMYGGQVFPMSAQHTCLDVSDYNFLKRFLDATKANLFFARGVIIVEGDAEQILLPIIAEKIGRPLSEYGISIVNVGHVGLFRYARIFQRKDDKQLGILVACIADLDIPPDEADYIDEEKRASNRNRQEETQKKQQRASGGVVKTFVSPQWTLEHDIALNSLIAKEVHIAVQLAKALKYKSLTNEDRSTIEVSANQQYCDWIEDDKTGQEIAVRIYEPLSKGQASKPEAAQQLVDRISKMYLSEINRTELFRRCFPSYLVDAIDYVSNKSGISIEEESIVASS